MKNSVKDVFTRIAYTKYHLIKSIMLFHQDKLIKNNDNRIKFAEHRMNEAKRFIETNLMSEIIHSMLAFAILDSISESFGNIPMINLIFVNLEMYFVDN